MVTGQFCLGLDSKSLMSRCKVVLMGTGEERKSKMEGHFVN